MLCLSPLTHQKCPPPARFLIMMSFTLPAGWGLSYGWFAVRDYLLGLSILESDRFGDREKICMKTALNYTKERKVSITNW